jgi:hypothetical protein
MAMMGNERSGAQPFLVASVFLGEVWMGIGVRPPFFFFFSLQLTRVMPPFYL